MDETEALAAMKLGCRVISTGKNIYRWNKITRRVEMLEDGEAVGYFSQNEFLQVQNAAAKLSVSGNSFELIEK